MRYNNDTQSSNTFLSQLKDTDQEEKLDEGKRQKETHRSLFDIFFFLVFLIIMPVGAIILIAVLAIYDINSSSEPEVIELPSLKGLSFPSEEWYFRVGESRKFLYSTEERNKKNDDAADAVFEIIVREKQAVVSITMSDIGGDGIRYSSKDFPSPKRWGARTIKEARKIGNNLVLMPSRPVTITAFFFLVLSIFICILACVIVGTVHKICFKE